MNKKYLLAGLLIVLTIIFRLANNSFQLFNFTPLIAVSLFSGTLLQNNKYAVWVPLLIMFLSDCFFQFFTNTSGFYGAGQLVNYGAFALVALLGNGLHNASFLKIGAYTIAGALIFFVLSNLGVWIFENHYAHSFSGLVKCYTLALPFYNADSTSLFFNSLLGNLVTSGLLYSAYHALLIKQLQNAKA